MSSTNRGSQRYPDDFYETPAWCVDAILPALHDRHLFVPSTLEPASGEGSIMRALSRSSHWACEDRHDLIRGMELDATRAESCCAQGFNVVQGDFLEQKIYQPGQFELILTNPPFSLAMEFIKQSLWLAGRKGHVCMLLRLSWMASAKRKAFHSAYPSDVYVLSKRPSFTSDGKTDSADYSWFIWGPKSDGHWRTI